MYPDVDPLFSVSQGWSTKVTVYMVQWRQLQTLPFLIQTDSVDGTDGRLDSSDSIFVLEFYHSSPYLNGSASRHPSTSFRDY